MELAEGIRRIGFGTRNAVPHGEVDEGVVLPVGVRCRQCGHEWVIE